VWRPTAPAGGRVCAVCAVLLYPDAIVVVTPMTVSEVEAWIKRQLQ
jgi:hypothetical protein